MERTRIADLTLHVGETREIRGWVTTVRTLSKMQFLVIRDASGSVQVFVDGSFVADTADIKPESVISLVGKINLRPKANVQKDGLGALEIVYEQHTVLSPAQTPPFELTKDTATVDDELRLGFRYLDLRTERMQRNIRMRDRIFTFIRHFLHEELFTEIETPYLTKGTPEGAREYIIPSRNHPGKFFVLPQSPQQFKQLLMVAGFEKYFQVVRCFRDEDQRQDRQPEFTQIDIEMSFTTEEEVLALTEKMLQGLVTALFPEKHFTQFPFPRIPFAEAMATYKSDKPDIRKNPKDPNELGAAFIVDFPLFERSETEKKLVAVHHLFTSPKDEDRALLDTAPEKVRAKQYDIALNGFEIAGGSIRIHEAQLQRQIFSLLSLDPEDAEKRFGHMLKAFSYGVPPHGGIAFGADRLVAVLLGESSIREVIPFPKTGDARDPMTGAPSDVSAQQIADVHIQLDSKK